MFTQCDVATYSNSIPYTGLFDSHLYICFAFIGIETGVVLAKVLDGDDGAGLKQRGKT